MTDPRQPAYDAVFAYLRETPPPAGDGYAQAVANARVWRAVEAALDAMDVPKVAAVDLYPRTVRDEADRSMTIPDGPQELPWNYLDTAVQVQLRAAAYPYGGGNPGIGVQLTAESLHAGQTIAIRLPEPEAMRLALAILGVMTPPPPPIEDDPVAKRLGLVPCCDHHNIHCEPPSELCCRHCTEVDHPNHPGGAPCVLDPEGTP